MQDSNKIEWCSQAEGTNTLAHNIGKHSATV